MIIRSIQWNVGACRIRASDADPLSVNSYSIPSIKYVIGQLEKFHPDIITLQEIHADDSSNQADIIARGLSMQYRESDFFSESHMESGQRLGHAIISRFPLRNHGSIMFINPHFSMVWKGDGKTVVTSHDKGVTYCKLQVEDTTITVKTLQLLPFDPFNVDLSSEEAKKVFEDVFDKIEDLSKNLIIQGDLNLGRYVPPVKELLPRLIDNDTHEVDLSKSTIPNGEKPDRVVYRGLVVKHVTVDDTVLTDHYPIVTDFESK